MQHTEKCIIVMSWSTQINQYQLVKEIQERQCCEWDWKGYKGPCGRRGEERRKRRRREEEWD